MHPFFSQIHVFCCACFTRAIIALRFNNNNDQTSPRCFFFLMLYTHYAHYPNAYTNKTYEKLCLLVCDYRMRKTKFDISVTRISAACT